MKERRAFHLLVPRQDAAKSGEAICCGASTWRPGWRCGFLPRAPENWKNTKQKTEKPAPLRQRRSGFSPTPLLALATSRHLNRQWSVADLIPTPPVFQRRKRGRAPLGPKKSRSGPRGASKAAAEEAVAGLWAENPLGHPWPSLQRVPHRPPPPPRAWPGRFPFLCFLSSFFFFFVSVPAGQARDPLPGRQRPLSPPAVPAAGLRSIPVPLTCPGLLLAPALPGPVPSFLKPLCL